MSRLFSNLKFWLAAFFLVVFTWAGWYAWQILNFAGHTLSTPGRVSAFPFPSPSLVPVQTLKSPLPQKIQKEQEVSMLVLDYGGVGQDGAYLTGTILVLSLAPKSITVTQFNLAHDL